MALHSLLKLPITTQTSNLHNTQFPKSPLFHSLKLYSPHNPSWLSSSTYHFLNSKPISATISSSLPTAKPERFNSAVEVPKWSWRAIKSYTLAHLEARKLKYPTTGTEAILLGLLVEGTSLAAKYLWKNGITVFKVREETIKLLGKADMYYFPPERPPLTEDALRALDWAVDHKLNSGNKGEITTTDLLLGLWSEVESPGYKILANLGFNDDKAKELDSLSSVPEFTEG